jgi:hypothetical protein
MESHFEAEVSRRARACAAHVQLPSPSSADRRRFEEALDQLMIAIRDLGPRFAFEREGRPEAMAAVRASLPAAMREVFDAVTDDMTCELAAAREAAYHAARVSQRPTT